MPYIDPESVAEAKRLRSDLEGCAPSDPWAHFERIEKLLDRIIGDAEPGMGLHGCEADDALKPRGLPWGGGMG